MESTFERASGGTSLHNQVMTPELFEAFTITETTLVNDKYFTHVRPANQLAYNELSDFSVQAGAIKCEIGGFYSKNESRSIEKGTRVLVIKPSPGADNGYILTILGSAVPVATTKKDLVSPDSFSFKSDKSGFHVDGKRNHISLYTSNDNEFLLTESEASIKAGQTILKINTKAFMLDNSLSKLDIQKDINIFSSGEITIGAGFYDINKAKKDIKIIGSGLLVNVEGGNFDVSSKNSTSKQLVKHDEIGAKYSINIGTNLVNPNILNKDTTAFDLNVLQGDINMHTTVGGVFIHASNILQKDSIKLVTGLAIRKAGFMQGIPPYASIDIGGIKGIRMEVIGAGADSLIIGPMNITGTTTGAVSFTSALATSITSGAAISLTSGAAVSITAGAAISLTAPILNLTAVPFINLGPVRAGAPTGSPAGFSALPACLFAGVPHNTTMIF